MGLIDNFWQTVKDVLTQPPYPSPCTGLCNQGRNCTCEQVAQQDYPNWPYPTEPAKWPFPEGTKP
jgi:hypothetical protein